MQNRRNKTTGWWYRIYLHLWQSYHSFMLRDTIALQKVISKLMLSPPFSALIVASTPPPASFINVSTGQGWSLINATYNPWYTIPIIPQRVWFLSSNIYILSPSSVDRSYWLTRKYIIHTFVKSLKLINNMKGQSSVGFSCRGERIGFKINTRSCAGNFRVFHVATSEQSFAINNFKLSKYSVKVSIIGRSGTDWHGLRNSSQSHSNTIIVFISGSGADTHACYRICLPAHHERTTADNEAAKRNLDGSDRLLVPPKCVPACHPAANYFTMMMACRVYRVLSAVPDTHYTVSKLWGYISSLQPTAVSW